MQKEILKTCIYIDAANIILSFKENKLNLDLEKLFFWLKDKYKNSKIIFFIGDVKYLESIKDILEKNDIQIIIKETIKEGGKLKANCDIEITNLSTIDVERENFNKFIFLTGDGDFVFLFDYIKNKNKEIKCICPTYKNTSIFIKRRDYLKVIFLEQIKFLQKEKGFK